MKYAARNSSKGKVKIILALVAMALVVGMVCALVYFYGDRNKQYMQKIDNLTQDIASLSDQLDDTASALDAANSEILRQKQAVESQDAKIDALESGIAEKDKKIKDYQAQLAAKKVDEGVGRGGAAKTGKVCYLTFDDGPSQNTLKILSILKTNKIHATFFVVGYGRLEYTKQMVADGHTVGLHSDCHEYGKIYASTGAFFSDLDALSAKVEKACGVKSFVGRFPGGTSNTASVSHCKGIMTTLSKEVEKRGYKYFDWNCDSGDASGNNVPVTKIMSNIRLYGTSNNNLVVLMHDTGAKGTTVEALPQIIKYYTDNGYTFAALTVDSPSCMHKPNN